MNMRVCTKCKQEFPATLEFFRPYKAGKYGLSAICKLCARKKEKEDRNKNPEKHRRYQETYQRNNSEKLRENRRANYDPQKRRSRYEKKREEYLQQGREYYESRKDDPVYKETRRQWIVNNRDKARARWHRRQARKKGLNGTYSTYDLERYRLIQGPFCFYCKRPLSDKYIVEHLYPIFHQGSNTIDNIVISCQSCNNHKHSKMPWIFCPRLKEKDFEWTETGYRWKLHPLRDGQSYQLRLLPMTD